VDWNEDRLSCIMKKTDLAFTRIELLFCFLGATLVTIPAVSLLASNKSESQRVVCFNNLRQIGNGFLSWANEHNDNFPWRLMWPQGQPPDGGTFGHPLGPNLWFQFLWASNHIGSPKVLVCPADAGTPSLAENWISQPAGLALKGYQNGAVSYFIGLHAMPNSPASLLSGDRNIAPTARNAGCSLMTGNVATLLGSNDPNVRWTNAIHGTFGHLLFGDGSVRFTTSEELRSVNPDNGDVQSIHILGK